MDAAATAAFIAKKAAEEQMCNLPFVRLHVNGQCGVEGHLINAFVNPKYSTGRVSDASKHQLIPLNEDGSVTNLGWSYSQDGFIVDNLQLRITHADYLSHLATWKYVAIRNSEGKFISCRRAAWFPKVGWTSLTEYREEIGEYEKFQVEYDEDEECFSFKSHNDMYLQLNRTFNTTPCRPPSFGWRVSPLLDDASAPATSSRSNSDLLKKGGIVAAKVAIALATGVGL
jgi:hypothetical protein